MNGGSSSAWDRFWFQGHEDAGRVALFRVAFFSLLALDLWLKIGFAAGYGAAGFNVTHLAWLDELAPVPAAGVMAILWLVQSYLCLRLAMGTAPRWAGAVLAVLYGGTYFISRLDQYQHHYLLSLLLGILAFVDWNRVRPARWPFQLVRVQISILYAWAAIAKLHPLWLDGTVVSQVPGPVQSLVSAAATRLSVEPSLFWSGLAWSGLVFEVVAAVAIHVPRARGVICVAGILFHLSIEFFLGISILLFSWYMVVLFLLVAPDRWFRPLRGRRLTLNVGEAVGLPWGVAALLLAIVAGASALLSLPLENMALLVGAVSLAAVAGEVLPRAGRVGRAVAHLGACVVLVGFHLVTSGAEAHYSERAVDALRRGEVEAGRPLAERAVAVAPRSPSAVALLAQFRSRDRADDQALELFARALDLEPDTSLRLEILVSRAVILWRSARREEAYGVMDEILRMDPEETRLPAGDPRVESMREAARRARARPGP